MKRFHYQREMLLPPREDLGAVPQKKKNRLNIFVLFVISLVGYIDVYVYGFQGHLPKLVMIALTVWIVNSVAVTYGWMQTTHGINRRFGSKIGVMLFALLGFALLIDTTGEIRNALQNRSDEWLEMRLENEQQLVAQPLPDAGPLDPWTPGPLDPWTVIARWKPLVEIGYRSQSTKLI